MVAPADRFILQQNIRIDIGNPFIFIKKSLQNWGMFTLELIGRNDCVYPHRIGTETNKSQSVYRNSKDAPEAQPQGSQR